MRTAILAWIVLVTLGTVRAPPVKADILTGPSGEMTTGPNWRWHLPDHRAPQQQIRDRESRGDAWFDSHCLRDWRGAENCG